MAPQSPRIREKRRDARQYQTVAAERQDLRKGLLQQAKQEWRQHNRLLDDQDQALQRKQEQLERELAEVTRVQKPAPAAWTGFTKAVLEKITNSAKTVPRKGRKVQKSRDAQIIRQELDIIAKRRVVLADLKTNLSAHLTEAVRQLNADLQNRPFVEEIRQEAERKRLAQSIESSIQFLRSHHVTSTEVLDQARLALMSGVPRTRLVHLIRNGIVDQHRMILHDRIRRELNPTLSTLLTPQDIDHEITRIGPDHPQAVQRVAEELQQAHHERAVRLKALHKRLQEELENTYYHWLQQTGNNTVDEFRKHRAMARQFASTLAQLEDQTALGLRRGHSLKNILLTHRYQIVNGIYGLHLEPEPVIQAYDRALEAFQYPATRPTQPANTTKEDEEENAGKEEPQKPRPAARRAGMPWDAHHEESVLDGLRTNSTAVLLHIASQAREVVRNAHIEHVPEREETVKIDGRNVKRRFIDIEDVKKLPAATQRIILTGEFSGWMNQNNRNELKLEFLPGCHLFVDVAGHLFKSVQTHPEMLDSEYLDQMLRCLQGKPDLVVPQRNGEGITGFDIHHTILYNGEPEKLFMHVAPVDRKGNPVSLIRGNGTWLDGKRRPVTPHFRLVTAFLKARPNA